MSSGLPRAGEQVLAHGRRSVAAVAWVLRGPGGQPIQVMSKIRMVSAVSSAWKLNGPYPEANSVIR